MAKPPALTEDGYEMQFGVNCLAHALLVKLFLPMLLERAELPHSDVRVVVLTSSAYRLAPKTGVDFKNVRTKQDSGPGARWTRYGQSKTAGLLLSVELARHYPQITSTVVHPGVINTGLVSGLPLGAKLVVHVGCFVQGYVCTFLVILLCIKDETPPGILPSKQLFLIQSVQPDAKSLFLPIHQEPKTSDQTKNDILTPTPTSVKMIPPPPEKVATT